MGSLCEHITGRLLYRISAVRPIGCSSPRLQDVEKGSVHLCQATRILYSIWVLGLNSFGALLVKCVSLGVLHVFNALTILHQSHQSRGLLISGDSLVFETRGNCTCAAVRTSFHGADQNLETCLWHPSSSSAHMQGIC